MEEKKTAKARPHNITIEGREKISISGVKDVASFDDNTIVLETEEGGLTIKGAELHIQKLSVDDGNLLVDGYVISCAYHDKAESKKSGSFFGNIFK